MDVAFPVYIQTDIVVVNRRTKNYRRAPKHPELLGSRISAMS